MKEITFHFVYSATIIKTPTGYRLQSMGQNIHVKDGVAVWLWNDTTGEQMMLSEFLKGRKFREFDPVKIFGTDKPKGSVIAGWLKSLWGTDEVYEAMTWVKNTVPLDVLLCFGGPLPGVTASAETGWHWSCSMQGTSNPRFYESPQAFKKHVDSL